MADKRTEKQINIDNQYNKVRYKQKSRFIRRENASFIFRILAIVLGVLLFATIIRYSQSPSDPVIPTFTGLFQKLTETEPMNVPFIDLGSIDLGDWGSFNFLRDFLMTLMSIVNVLIFFINGIINCITYIVWVLDWLFV